MLTVYLDLNCPFSFILHERLLLNAQYNAIQWRYIEHAPAINTDSESDLPLETLQHDVALAIAQADSLNLDMPEFCVNTRLALLSLMMVERLWPEKATEYRCYLFRSYWQFGVDISEYAALHAILASLQIKWVDYDQAVEHALLTNHKQWLDDDPHLHLPTVKRFDDQLLLGLSDKTQLLQFLKGVEAHSDGLEASCDYTAEYALALIDLPYFSQHLRDASFGFQMSEFSCVEDFIAQSKETQFDAVLLNFSLQLDSDIRNKALHTLKAFLRAHLDYPIFCVIERSDPALETLAFNLGANDILYLRGSFLAYLARIKKRIDTFKAIDLLSEHAHVDGMTGLMNKATLMHCLLREWRIAARAEHIISVILLDFDYFKYYNDHFGHYAGDECLKKLAHTIQGHVYRPSDIAARFGGEEFLVLLPHTQADDALMIAERIRQAIADEQIQHSPLCPNPLVTVSVGLAYGTVEDLGSIENLLLLADKALYQAKEQGRNRVQCLSS